MEVYWNGRKVGVFVDGNTVSVNETIDLKKLTKEQLIKKCEDLALRLGEIMELSNEMSQYQDEFNNATGRLMALESELKNAKDLLEKRNDKLRRLDAVAAENERMMFKAIATAMDKAFELGSYQHEESKT